MSNAKPDHKLIASNLLAAKAPSSEYDDMFLCKVYDDGSAVLSDTETKRHISTVPCHDLFYPDFKVRRQPIVPIMDGSSLRFWLVHQGFMQGPHFCYLPFSDKNAESILQNATRTAAGLNDGLLMALRFWSEEDPHNDTFRAEAESLGLHDIGIVNQFIKYRLKGFAMLPALAMASENQLEAN